MKEALKDMPVSEFPVPSGVVFSKICTESGMLAGESCPNTTTEVSLKVLNPGSSAIYTRESKRWMSALNQDSLQADIALLIKLKGAGTWRLTALGSSMTGRLRKGSQFHG